MNRRTTKLGMLAALLGLNAPLLAMGANGGAAQSQDWWCTIQWQGGSGTCVCSVGFNNECYQMPLPCTEIWEWCHDY